jgi:hypothetical protein
MANETWWLTVRPDASGQEFLDIMDHRSKILAILERYKNVSSQTKEITSYFTTFRVGVVSENQIFWYTPNSETNLVPPEYGISFIPMDEFMRTGDSLPSAAYWSHACKSMFLVAHDFPEPLFAGVIFHEFGHAYRHKGDTASTPARSLHDRAAEEVEMNTLGATVMNEATKGKFFEAIDKVLDREHPNDFKHAVAALTAEDMLAFDIILGADNSGKIDAGILNSEYYLMIGFRAIDRVRGSFEDKVQGYLWITGWAGRSTRK